MLGYQITGSLLQLATLLDLLRSFVMEFIKACDSVRVYI
jgi:hypothetical protein